MRNLTFTLVKSRLAAHLVQPVGKGTNVEDLLHCAEECDNGSLLRISCKNNAGKKKLMASGGNYQPGR